MTPEDNRGKRFYDKCLKKMRKSDPQIQEDGFHELLPHTAEFVDELILEVEHETDPGFLSWLYELLSETGSDKTIPIFAKILETNNSDLHEWAVRGLQKVDTKQSRTVLFNSGVIKEG